jgi:hypothetical protein
MKKAVLAVVSCLLYAMSAGAEVKYIEGPEDTVALYAADSTSALLIDGSSRVWLDIIHVPLRYTDIALACDTLHASRDFSGNVIPGGSYAFMHRDSLCTAYADSVNAVDAVSNIAFAVQAREVLPSRIGTDADNASLSSPSAYADSTVIPWIPRSFAPANTATTYLYADSVIINHWASTNAGSGSTEQTAYIMAKNAGWSSKRSVRVDFSSASNCAPFIAKFASFRWRLIAGPSPTRVRVVVGYSNP